MISIPIETVLVEVTGFEGSGTFPRVPRVPSAPFWKRKAHGCSRPASAGSHRPPTKKELTSFGGKLFFGRGDRIRTCDILLPKQARYQLRYTSIFIRFNGFPIIGEKEAVVKANGRRRKSFSDKPGVPLENVFTNLFINRSNAI